MRSATYATALTLMLGWLLWIGKPILLPVFAAVISVYILSTAAASMQALPILGRLPAWARRGLILILFAIVVILLFILVINNLVQVVAILPQYETNLEQLITDNASILGIENEPTWENLRRATLDQIDVRAWMTPALLSLRGFGVTLFLVVLYSSFFIAERGVMARKVMIAMGDADVGERAIQLLSRINERIGQYLFVKTVINMILGALSFIVLLFFGIEFALFWSVLIAFLNYIPYIGSMIGVIFPVLLSLAQFGTLSMAGSVMITLTIVQIFVAFFLEPRMMGRAFNLSPFVVLLALAFWSTLWGLPGALLAVPLTVSLILVFAELKTTRPIAVLLSASGKL
ncbi:MAG: AI-2E family transporter [Candidatus Aquiluna sp. XM-24bin5]|nr:MAG: AI-2E family transporter [Candidatus Aquiluna sp. XM-24bin5]